jgi:HEAT repeat protein
VSDVTTPSSTGGPVIRSDAPILPSEAERFGALARRLSPHSAVRIAAESLLSGSEMRPDQIEALFSALTRASRVHWRERLVAAWCLGRVPLKELEREAAAGTLLSLLETSTHNGPTIVGRIWAIYGLLFPLVLMFDINSNPGPVFVTIWTVAAIAASMFAAPVLHAMGRDTFTVRSAAAMSLGHLRVAEAIGPLARAVNDRDPHVRDAASAALHEALPMLSAEHFGRLSTDAIGAIAALLKHADNLLVFKALDALEKVGTASAISAVDALRNRARMSSLQQRAADVLEVLRERKRLEDQGKTLLRPMTGPEGQSGLVVPSRPEEVESAKPATLQVHDSRG